MAVQENDNHRNDSYHREKESDANKLANKHLADPAHVITEEDMRNIKVGVSGEPDEPTKKALREAEDRVADRKADNEEDTTPGAQKATPWDIIEP